MRRFIFALPLALALSADAQPLSYTLLESEGPKPAGRVDGTIAYDPASRRVFLFGGSAGTEKNDLWVYSFGDRRWTELQPEGERPPARLGHTTIFDAARRRLVVFGGQAAGFFNDTWAYEIDRNQWRRLAASGAAPSRRYGHSGVLDAARDRMIISHGFTNSGRFDDTWSFDLVSDTWRDISPQSGARPLRRCLHHAVTDAANNQMLLYGGCASGFGPCPLGDLWSFDLNSNRWTEITASPRPAAREHYGVAFDSARNRMILFGGAGPGKLNDTWEFDPQARTWRETPLAGPAPAARSRHHGAFASDRGVSLFFGGATSATQTNELWLLGPGLAAPQRPEISRSGIADAFSGGGGAIAPGQIVSLYGAGLGPADAVTLRLDPNTGSLPASGPGVTVTFGGIAAPLYFVSSSQINAQVPYELQGNTETSLVVTVNGSASERVTIPVVPAKPGLFPRIFRADGSVVTADNAPSSGDIVVLFATGHGATSPAGRTGAIPADGIFPEPLAATSVTIGGRPAQLLFKGQAPGAVGVLQLNARIPEGLGANPAAAVVLRVGEAESQAGVSIAIR